MNEYAYKEVRTFMECCVSLTLSLVVRRMYLDKVVLRLSGEKCTYMYVYGRKHMNKFV